MNNPHRLIARAKAALVVVCGVAIAGVVAIALSPSGTAPAPVSPAQVKVTPTGPATKPVSRGARKRQAPQLTLEEQAALAAARYFEAEGTYDGDRRAYRRKVGRLIMDGPEGVRTVRGMEKMNATATATDVRYANPMEAVVFVSGTRRMDGRTYVANLDVTLVMERGKYRVRSAWSPHAGY